MYTQFHIRNFRGLRDVSIENVGRINLIVGPNNIGKTSLLEAIWLFHSRGYPQLTRNVANFRGFEPIPNSPDLLWHGLFHNFSVEELIEIVGKDSDVNEHILGIRLRKLTTQRIEPESIGRAPDSLGQVGDMSVIAPEALTFEYQVNQVPTVTASMTALSGTFELKIPTLPMKPLCIILPARRQTGPEDLATRFTSVQDSGELPALVQSLQLLEPDLQTLTLGYVERQPLIRGHLGMSNPLPLPLLGGGVVRITEILLAILAARDGVVLVDEAENGIYHRNMEASWKAINSASKGANGQIVATTHSQECVQAALAAFAGEDAVDFRLHRLERKRGEIRAVTYDHETAAAALEMNLEVR